MDVERIEQTWRSGDREAALALARTSAGGNDELALAEALLRCAHDLDVPEWEAAARLAIQLRENAWPPGHPRASYAALPLADLLSLDGRFDEAEAILRHCETLAQAAAEGGDSDPLRDAVFTRARLYLASGRDADAEAALLQALAVEERGRHPARPPFTLPATELGALYTRQGRRTEAAAIAARAAAILADYCK
jgi:tetratricopeptide (TPR) repeat protein